MRTTKTGSEQPIRKPILGRGIAIGVLAGLATLAGCSTNTPIDQTEWDYPVVRSDPDAGTSFRSCGRRSIALDSAAQLEPSRKAFKQVAASIDRCLRVESADADVSDLERRMTLHALGVLSFIRAAEYDAAVARLQAFELLYPGRDLLFADGHSVLATLQLLLGDYPPNQSVERALLHTKQVLNTRAN